MSPSPVNRIYALCCPFTGEVRYVGQTIEPLLTRLCAHMHAARRGRPKHSGKGEWLRDLDAQGTRPSIALLEECAAGAWRERERYWIAKFPNLFNRAKGGGGGSSKRIYGLPEHLKAQLGKVADAVIAGEAGVTRKAVAYYRGVLGIPASFDRTRNTPPPRNAHTLFKPIELPDECINALGTEPDYFLAKLYGVDKGVIARRRQSLGIPTYAAATGNDGRIRAGEPHRRWQRGNQCHPAP